MRSSSSIVVLDDSPGDRALIRRALLPAAPRRPLVDFGDPDETLGFLRRVPSAWLGTLVLDWRLGTRCGVEVIAAVRATPELARAEVIVLSGTENADEHSRAMAAGADDWIAKPQDWDGYEAVARRIVSGAPRDGCGSGEASVLGQGLHGAAPGLTSRAMGAMSIMQPPQQHSLGMTSPHLALARMEAAASESGAVGPMLREFFGFMMGAAAQLVDREDVEIKQVCERHRVRVGLVKSPVRDQVIEAKRSAVLRDLIALGWDDPTLMEHFAVSKATLERRRAEVRAGKGMGARN